MPDINSAVPDDLPSTRKLIRSTILAAVIAAVLLATVVLPAEYGVDPIGVGRILGLTEMGRIKQSLAREAKLADQSPVPATQTTATATAASAPLPIAAEATPAVAGTKTDVTRIQLRPGEGKEIKLVMREGARVQYSWSTEGGVVNYDTHADSVNPRRDYHGYAKGTAVPSDSGVLVAAFEGSHGWFWRNRTKTNVTLTLETRGEYTQLKELK